MNPWPTPRVEPIAWVMMAVGVMLLALYALYGAMWVWWWLFLRKRSTAPHSAPDGMVTVTVLTDEGPALVRVTERQAEAMERERAQRAANELLASLDQDAVVVGREYDGPARPLSEWDPDKPVWNDPAGEPNEPKFKNNW